MITKTICNECGTTFPSNKSVSRDSESLYLERCWTHGYYSVIVEFCKEKSDKFHWH